MNNTLYKFIYRQKNLTLGPDPSFHQELKSIYWNIRRWNNKEVEEYDKSVVTARHVSESFRNPFSRRSFNRVENTGRLLRYDRQGNPPCRNPSPLDIAYFNRVRGDNRPRLLRKDSSVSYILELRNSSLRVMHNREFFKYAFE